MIGGLPRVKASDGMKNVITKDFNYKHEIVREWERRRDMPRISQCRVLCKRLSEEFSLRDR